MTSSPMPCSLEDGLQKEEGYSVIIACSSLFNEPVTMQIYVSGLRVFASIRDVCMCRPGP